MNPRYSKPHSAYLCYRCSHGDAFDLTSPLRFGFCTAQSGSCVAAKKSCKDFVPAGGMV